MHCAAEIFGYNTPMQRNILIVLGIAALLALGGFAAWKQGYFAGPATENATSTPTSASGGGYGVQASSTGDVAITPLPVPSGSDPFPQHPLINRQVSVPASFSAEAKAIILADIESIRAALRKNPKDLQAWVELGVRYKAINEYEAAREAWEYVSLVSPDNIVSFNNLGDLQHYVFKDYARAELNFLQAIHNNPNYLLSYLNLHDLYRLSYKQNTTKAEDILQQGIKQNPKAIDLMVALATYYRGKGRIADAKVFYERAIAVATDIGNTALAAALKAEIKAMEGNVQ